MKEDGSDIRRLTNDSTFPITDAALSPDGNKIALTSPVGGIQFYGGTIYIMNADGTGKYLLTKPNPNDFNSGTGNHPVWSPDSKSLAFWRYVGPEFLANRDILTINIDGTNEHQITHSFDTSEYVSDWSPDRSTLLGNATDYIARDSLGYLLPHTWLTFLDLQGNYLRSWGQVGLTIGDPIYSTSGKKIAFLSSKMEHIGMYIMNEDGSNDSLLTNRDYIYYAPVSWSLDDTKILYNAGFWS